MQLGYNVPDSLTKIRIAPHVCCSANSYYNISENYISMGSEWFNGNSSVPCCEDADVILHEYAHAIQQLFTKTGMATSYTEVLSVREGSADYWTTSYKRSLNPDNWAEFEIWVSMGIPERRLNVDRVYNPYLQPGYSGGVIWGSALMKIWEDLGRDITDQLFLEAHLIWGIEPFLKDAATAFMKADLNLYKGSHLCQIYARFQEHGLIDTNQIINTTSFVNQIVNSNKIVFSCSDLNAQDVTVQSGKLTLDAAGTTRIISDFKVDLGAQLEIK